jgi:cytoskeletal protein CcmA (bactofilin family)
MWSDRRQGESYSRAGSGAEERVSAFADSTGAVSSLAVIGRGMLIRGQIRSKEGMYVDGEVNGTLEMPECRLTVGPHGRVDANVRAREIEILGTVAGDLEAGKKITVRKGGRLVGDLRTPGIVIEEGAYYKGKIEIVNVENRPQLARPEAVLKKTEPVLKKAAFGG